jgi:hypothetical protein
MPKTDRTDAEECSVKEETWSDDPFLIKLSVDEKAALLAFLMMTSTSSR